MGFDINALVLTSRREKRRKIWQVDYVLNMGKISAPLRNDPEVQARDPRGRAAMYFVHCIFEKLSEYINEKGASCRAPRFEVEGKKRYREMIRCFSGKNNQVIPGSYTVQRHNFRPRTPDPDMAKQDPVFAMPLVWVPCELLLQWIEEVGATESELKLAPSDTAGRFIFDRWRDAIIHAQERGGKTLFFSDSINDYSII